MALLRQIAAITWWNLRAIPVRLGTSMVICVGIAGVVVVLITVLAMATGLQRAVGSAGQPDRAVLLRSGAVAEVVSALDRDVEFALAQAPGVRLGTDGKPAISLEIVLSVTLPDRTGRPVGIGLRGLTAGAWAVPIRGSAARLARKQSCDRFMRPPARRPPAPPAGAAGPAPHGVPSPCLPGIPAASGSPG